MNRRGRRFREEVDTNVVGIDFKIIEEDAQLAAGDPVFCSECRAVFSMHSALKEKEVEQRMDSEEVKREDPESDDDEKVWTCEYCNQDNMVSLEGPEIPTQEAVNYILEPAKVVESEQGKQSVIFCLDVSGSMCVTTPVHGKFKMKGIDHQAQMRELMKFSDGSDQFHNEGRNITYVSRLQCV